MGATSSGTIVADKQVIDAIATRDRVADAIYDIGCWYPVGEYSAPSGDEPPLLLYMNSGINKTDPGRGRFAQIERFSGWG